MTQGLILDSVRKHGARRMEEHDELNQIDCELKLLDLEVKIRDLEQKLAEDSTVSE